MKTFVIVLIGAGTGALACLGEIYDSNFLRYYVPGYVHLLISCWASWSFFKQKENYSLFIIWTGWFTWFYLQILNPVTGTAELVELDSYTSASRLWGVVVAAVGPSLLYGGVVLWLRPLRSLAKKLQTPLSARGIDIGYMAAQRWSMLLVALIFIVYAVSGGLIVSSVRMILYMRNTDAGPIFQLDGRLSSIVAFATSALSLLVLTVFFRKTRYRWIWGALLPLTAIWSLGLLFCGARSYLIALVVCLGIIIIGRIKVSILGLSFGACAAVLIIGLAQFAYVTRTSGIKNIDWSEYHDKVFRLQGLETLADQTRAFYYYMEPASERWFPVHPLAGFVIGIMHRPIECIYFFVPRSLWTNKPLDPSFTGFTRFSLQLANQDLPFVETFDGKDTGFGTGNTPGFYGRDVIRYGPLGLLSLTFWFSFMIAIGHIAWRARIYSPFADWIAACIAGTIFCMWRGPDPMWLLILMPAAVLLSIGWRKSILASQNTRGVRQ